MASSWFPLTLLLLDTYLSYISALLVYKYYTYNLLSVVWLAAIVKLFLFSAIVPRLSCPSWISSTPLYVLILCLSPPLYQTLRFLLTSHSPELHSGLLHLHVCHLPLHLACLLWNLLWNLATPHCLQKKSPGEDGNIKWRNWKNFKRLVRYLIQDWIPLCGAFVSLIVLVIGDLCFPYNIGRMIDVLSTKYTESEFINAIFWMTTFYMTSSISRGFRDWLLTLCIFSLIRRLRLLLFRSLIKQEIQFFEVTKAGEITSCLSYDTACVSRSVADNVNNVLSDLLKCVAIYTIMFSLSWKLTLLIFMISPLTWITQKIYNYYYQDLVQKIQDSIAKSSDLAKETIELIKTVKSFATEEEEVQRYEKSLQETRKLQTQRDLMRAVYRLVSRILYLSTKAIMLFYGHQFTKRGLISSGKMVSFIMYQIVSENYIQNLVYAISEMTHSAGAAQKIVQYLDREPMVSNEGTRCPDKIKGVFEFKNVTFSYTSLSDTPALQNVSFTLPPGSVTALVGPSGGGKTTCVSLLQRFYEPQSGEILLDGKPLREYTHRFLHSKVALVAQEPVLFAGSVRDNISYGLQDPPEEQLRTAARQANAEDFIMGMERTFDTDVGESGSQLGAGQKQRVALSRALARRPQLLILDEVSSCLDAETEHEIQQTLQNIPGLSLLIIAHRLRTIQQADQILVLEGGNITERGTHDELIEKKGVYHRLLHGHFLDNGELESGSPD